MNFKLICKGVVKAKNIIYKGFLEVDYLPTLKLLTTFAMSVLGSQANKNIHIQIKEKTQKLVAQKKRSQN